MSLSTQLLSTPITPLERVCQAARILVVDDDDFFRGREEIETSGSQLNAV